MPAAMGAARRAAIATACSCPLDACNCRKQTPDGSVCERCERDHAIAADLENAGIAPALLIPSTVAKRTPPPGCKLRVEAYDSSDIELNASKEIVQRLRATGEYVSVWVTRRKSEQRFNPETRRFETVRFGRVMVSYMVDGDGNRVSS